MTRESIRPRPAALATLTLDDEQGGGVAFCANCGNELSDEAPSCPKCGHPRAVGRRTGGPDGGAVASLVLGILGIIACPLILSIPAVIVGSAARQRMRQDPTIEGEALARAGVILGWVGIGLTALFIVGAFVALILGSWDTHIGVF